MKRVIRENLPSLHSPHLNLQAHRTRSGLPGMTAGFLDFTDSVAVLPQARYDAVSSNPDSLIDGPISGDYDELGLFHGVGKVNAIGCHYFIKQKNRADFPISGSRARL